ncbi:hypothetical protein PG988_012515 [Apiospora saccharicola]
MKGGVVVTTAADAGLVGSASAIRRGGGGAGVAAAVVDVVKPDLGGLVTDACALVELTPSSAVVVVVVVVVPSKGEVEYAGDVIDVNVGPPGKLDDDACVVVSELGSGTGSSPAGGSSCTSSKTGGRPVPDATGYAVDVDTSLSCEVVVDDIIPPGGGDVVGYLLSGVVEVNVGGSSEAVGVEADISVMIPESDDDVSAERTTLDDSCGDSDEVVRAVPVVTAYAVIVLCGVVVVISSGVLVPWLEKSVVVRWSLPAVIEGTVKLPDIMVLVGSSCVLVGVVWGDSSVGSMGILIGKRTPDLDVTGGEGSGLPMVVSSELSGGDVGCWLPSSDGEAVTTASVGKEVATSVESGVSLSITSVVGGRPSVEASSLAGEAVTTGLVGGEDATSVDWGGVSLSGGASIVGETPPRVESTTEATKPFPGWSVFAAVFFTGNSVMGGLGGTMTTSAVV